VTKRIANGLSGKGVTEIIVGWDIEQTRLRAVGHRRPIFAAPQRRAELGVLPGPRLARGVDLGPAGLRVELHEHVLLYEGLAVDEIDLVGGALKHPQIAVTGGVDQTLHCLAVALIID